MNIKEDVIFRSQYWEKVKPFIGQSLIKVFTGQRRTGKSYLLKMLARHFQEHQPDLPLIYIDKERYEFDPIRDYHDLIKYVEANSADNGKFVLMIDEVQEITDFEKGLRHFLNEGRADIYITGSNAQILSGELADRLSGRYVKIHVHGLSYDEFLTFQNLSDSDDALLKYLKWGGLPFIRHLYKNDQVIFEYLRNITDAILLKDVVRRHKIKNTDFLENLVLFIAANTGNLITAKKISDYLKSQRLDVSVKVVLEYLKYLQNSFMLYKVRRRDVASKKIFAVNNKYFFEDWGMRNALLGLARFSPADVLENVVFRHLLTLDYEVYIGKLNGHEIDFVAEKDGRTVYIQVAYLLADEKTKEREFGNLLKIKDNFPKYVVSMDPLSLGEVDGVKHLRLREFLTLKKL